MMKSKTLLALLGLALTLGITSCKDNDLSDGTNGDNPSGQVTEQNYQKYEALQTLLGVVANVDSLPQNWDTKDYAEEPTIGTVKDASNPYVRYVVTSSAVEADREFRSMISQGTDGTAKSSTWKQDGVGSLDFKVLNQTDCYATLDVNVQQLPHLTQLRFVPASVIGENKIIKPYYQFGDVIKQTVGTKTVYWVCVRPCDKTGKLEQSHWCTLQLVPKDEKNSNYKKIADNYYLPTVLGSNKGDAQRMVQNFFNVLRIMRHPEFYDQSELPDAQRVGIDKISYEDFGYQQAFKASKLWRQNEIWDKLRNEDYPTDVFEGICAKFPSPLRAYYYGYNKVWFGSGNYNTYYLDISCNANDGIKFFNVVTPQTEVVNNSNPVDYSVFEKNGTEELDGKTTPTFIVKHRTGADLENTWWHNDSNPVEGFASRLESNNMEEIVVSNKQEVKETTEEHYYTLGDFIDKTLVGGGYYNYKICVRPSYYMSGTTDKKDWNNYALFLSLTDKADYENYAELISDKCRAFILYQLAKAYAYNNKLFDYNPTSDMDVEDKFNFFKTNEYISQSKYYNDVISFKFATILLKKEFYKVSVVGDKITIRAKFGDAGTYEFSYGIAGASAGSSFTLRHIAEKDLELKSLKIYLFEDINDKSKDFEYGEARRVYDDEAEKRKIYDNYQKELYTNFMNELVIEK